MSPRRERETLVQLEGMSEDQIAFVREMVSVALVGRAGNLRALNELADPKGAVREVAALARLVEWLDLGSVRVPDRAATEAVEGLAEDVDGINAFEEIFARYEKAIWERDTMSAFLAHFQGVGGADTPGGRP
ncbi:MAG TPA: hypothetical protein VHZ54_14135 [Solirubrobacterales bacterium]|jgi:hypothetical protein|nr:hypothetical protein [Solirubrobacterales bacterium]